MVRRGSGAPLLRRLPLAIIFRAVGAQTPIMTFARGLFSLSVVLNSSARIYQGRLANPPE
jgi:hypothetical protein